MQTLEIVRLSLIHFGVGLLPFAYVGLILGGLLHWLRGTREKLQAWRGINVIIWVGSMLMCVVKVVGLVKGGADGRRGSRYPISDQIIDVAVIAAVYAAISVLEVVLGRWEAT